MTGSGWVPPKAVQDALAEAEMARVEPMRNLPSEGPIRPADIEALRGPVADESLLPLFGPIQVTRGGVPYEQDKPGWCSPPSDVVAPGERGSIHYDDQREISLGLVAPDYPAATAQMVQAALIKQNEAADALLALCPWAELGHSPQHAGHHEGQPCPYWVALAHLTGQPDPRDRIAEWRVPVPFKDGKPLLSLNDRSTNYMAHASKVEKVKALTRQALRDADIPPMQHAHIEMHYRPKTRQLRDVDNLVATLKPMIDAFHQPDVRSGWVGLLAGDDARYVSWSPPVLHEPDKAKGPATWLLVRTSLETR